MFPLVFALFSSLHRGFLNRRHGETYLNLNHSNTDICIRIQRLFIIYVITFLLVDWEDYGELTRFARFIFRLSATQEDQKDIALLLCSVEPVADGDIYCA